jgi:K+-transporting ATPase ATPase C chain
MLMSAHLRANLWLLALTVVLCSVLYPLALLGLGQAVFRDKAQGSLVTDAAGNPVGSRLIAQPFTGDEYFQPRPSAAGYKADASAASNWAASNYLLRERVAQALGPVVKYGDRHRKAGRPVGPDVEAWLHEHPEAVAAWAKAHTDAPGRWLKADKAYAALVAAWKQQAKKEGDAAPEDVVPFFSHLAAQPAAEREKWPDGLHVVAQSVFFESWRDAHAEDDLEPVPADMVMASGSGLDPHITLKNALYQLDRVAGKWAELTRRDAAQVRKEIEQALNDRAEAPLGGLAGVKLVNVLETNLALRDLYAAKKTAGR